MTDIDTPDMGTPGTDAIEPAPASPPALVTAGLVALGIAAIAVSARLTLPVPGTDVPQSAQTLAVLLVGGLLGARSGTLALVGYLLVGGLGLPVFADGAAGWPHLIGPTSGYLVGFVGAAALVGWARDRGRLERFPSALAVMILAHGLILLPGWGRLASTLGPGPAYQAGVGPFLWGGVVKSALAAGVVAGVARLRRPAHSTPTE